MHQIHNTFCFFIITEKLDEEKKEREHLLALNQVIAQQVLQKRRSLPGIVYKISILARIILNKVTN